MIPLDVFCAEVGRIARQRPRDARVRGDAPLGVDGGNEADHGVTHRHGIGGEVAISMTATIIMIPLRTTSASRIRRKRKCPLMPMRNRIVAR